MSNLLDPIDYQDLSHKRLLKTLSGASGAFQPIKRPSKLRLLGRTQLRLWKMAWAEFSRTKGYTWMKRGAGMAALLLFTIAGQSVYTVAYWTILINCTAVTITSSLLRAGCVYLCRLLFHRTFCFRTSDIFVQRDAAGGFGFGLRRF